MDFTVFLMTIFGVALVIAIGFIALVFLTKKKSPDQSLIGQVASGISEAERMGKMPTATPVEPVIPTANNIAPNLPSAFDPVTGAPLQPTNSPSTNTQGKQNIQQNPESSSVSNENVAPILNEVKDKIENLDKKLDEVDKKVDETSNSLDKKLKNNFGNVNGRINSKL